MKTFRISAAILMLAVVAGFTSCSNDDGPDNGDEVKVKGGAFVLNQGSYQMNNAGMAYFKFDKDGAEIVNDIFFDVNGYKLGDNATDIARHKGKVYISMTGSNCIYRLSEKGLVEARALFHTDADLQGGVRYMAFDGDYLYATFYGGVVARISVKDMQVTAKLQTGGGNLEGIAECDGKLYVADSYSYVYDSATGQTATVYNDKLYVIDTKTFTVSGTIPVALNPNKLIEEDDKIFLISWGNYADKGYSFQMIEPKNGNKVTELGVATDMGAGNDKVYLVNSVTDWSTWQTTNTWSSYDIKGHRMESSSFMKDAPDALTSGHISMIAVDDDTDDIYIGTTQYTLGNGSVYRFDKNGYFKTDFDCGGQNPVGMVFL